MMKNNPVLFIFSFLLLLSSCSKEAANSGDKLVRVRLAGQVESEYFYDAAGRLIRSVFYNSTNVIRSEVTNTYDSDGRLIKQYSAINISSSITATKMDSGYNEYTYGADGKLTEARTYHRSSGSLQLAGMSVPMYDAQGRTVAVTLFDPNTNVAWSKRTYAYNAQGNISVEEFFQYSVGQGPYQHLEYEYDDKKNPLKGNWVFPFGANNNNITKINGTNYYSNMGVYVPAGLTGSNITVYKEYTHSGYPAVVNEYGNDRVYEYQY